MPNVTNTIIKYIIEKYTVDMLISMLDDAIPEFLYDGWKDEFEDMHEAYEETGRDAAHDQVIKEVIDSGCKHIDSDFNIISDQYYIVSKAIRSYMES